MLSLSKDSDRGTKSADKKSLRFVMMRAIEPVLTNGGDIANVCFDYFRP